MSKTERFLKSIQINMKNKAAQIEPVSLLFLSIKLVQPL